MTERSHHVGSGPGGAGWGLGLDRGPRAGHIFFVAGMAAVSAFPAALPRPGTSPCLGLTGALSALPYASRTAAQTPSANSSSSRMRVVAMSSRSAGFQACAFK